ncbi:alpha/beta fold hydrolase [Streptomyces sp. NPDC058674]|uniref:alpha/beta fold hydrolase n=1 Tax=Streptomyces sp. NPDC058674 TaxID=3346592 RepID=UPI003651CC70
MSGRTRARARHTVHGTGEPVVLVPGGGGSGAIWEHHQVPALTAAGYRVVTLDHPDGPGPAPLSAADLAASVRESVEALGLPPCRLVGHSFGALAVQELLLAAPELAVQAVLVATRGRPDPVGAAMARAEEAAAGREVLLPPAYEAFVRLTQNLSPRTLADEAATEEWLDLFELSALAAPSGRSAGSGRHPRHRTRPLTHDRLPAYPAIGTPVLVVGFADDLLAPARLGREVADAVPGARYLELPDCGHLGFLERPAAFNEAVLGFFATRPPLPGGPRAL